MTTQKPKSNLWAWIVVALIVAVLAVAALYYIGWLDYKSHVDTPAGDNVEQQYMPADPSAAESPAEADWQNADHKTLREAIVDPEAEPQTPPSSAR